MNKNNRVHITFMQKAGKNYAADRLHNTPYLNFTELKKCCLFAFNNESEILRLPLCSTCRNTEK